MYMPPKVEGNNYDYKEGLTIDLRDLIFCCHFNHGLYNVHVSKSRADIVAL